MFRHYLKIAFRNIRKYALQNVVNVLGFALGFVCLSLSIIWIRYENSFDTFHKDADRIFTVSVYHLNNGQTYHGTMLTARQWANLKELPEIEEYTQFDDFNEDAEAVEFLTDKVFFDFFDIRVAEGSDKFKSDPNLIAVTRSCAEKYFPGRSPIGETLHDKTIVAILEDFPGRTELMFDALALSDDRLDDDGHLTNPYGMHGTAAGHNQFFKVRKGTDIRAFIEKADEIIRFQDAIIFKVLPITDIHLKKAQKDMYVKYEHVQMLCLAGIVLFICAMVNFILFSLVRLDYRKREMALRMVNGSSPGKLFAMLMVEFGIVLLSAMVIGLVMNILFEPTFSTISAIRREEIHIISGSIKVMIPVLALSLAVCAVSIWSVRRRSMQTSIARGHGNIFRKACIGVQLFISVLFIFIVAVMARQLGMIRNHDWGMRVKDTAVLTIYNPAHPDRKQNALSAMNMYFPPDDESGKARNASWFRSVYGQNYNYSDGEEYLNRIDGQHGLTSSLRQLPYVTGLYTGFGDGYNLNRIAQQEASINEKTVEGVRFKPTNDNRFVALDILNSDAVGFLELTVIDGDIPDRPVADDELVITENLQKEFKLGPVSSEPELTISHEITRGATYTMDDNGEYVLLSPEQSITVSDRYRVIAVVKDLYTTVFDPAFTPMYAFCAKGNRRLMPQNYSFSGYWSEPMITLTYESGMSRRLKSDVDRLMTEAGLDYDLTFSEDRFFESLRSQRHLRNMIMAVGGVCILICLFGIWSMIMLACQERRREIAVRKVHGARKRDILKIFGREYGGMLVVTSAFAFAVGYMIMHRWLQQYEQQTAISWWLYLLILAGMALVISLTVLHRVSRAASENPSVVIKNE